MSKCCLGAAGQIEMLFWSCRTGRNLVLEQLDTSKCRPAAAGQAELASRSSRKGRNVVWEQHDRSKCRLGAAGLVRSKCSPGAAGQVEMSPQSSRTGRKGGQEVEKLDLNAEARLEIYSYIYRYICIIYIYK